MTKVTVEYDLVRALGDDDAEAVSRAHGVYGIARLRLAPTLDKISVDYDASRLSESDVASWLLRVGVPVKSH